VKVEIERPAKWAAMKFPDQATRDLHESWLRAHGEPLAPDECFLCWALLAAGEREER
jgi:hypothetical protein